MEVCFENGSSGKDGRDLFSTRLANSSALPPIINVNEYLLGFVVGINKALRYVQYEFHDWFTERTPETDWTAFQALGMVRNSA